MSAQPETFAEYVSGISDAELDEIIAAKERALACAYAERRRRALTAQ